MMKLFKEEKTGLKIGLNRIRLILLLFFLQEIILPQIPFKGFCKINSFNVGSGFNRLISLNFDNNEYSDILIYNPLQKNVELYSGTGGTSFQLKRKFDAPFEISNLQPITQQNNLIESYAFTSRKNRTFGTLKLDESGSVSIINQIKFDYYPENISVSYNQNNNEYEFLVSGNSFYGISILSKKTNDLFEKKITSKTVFMDAKFIDLNSNGYDDFVAVNTIRNKLHFFFRNSKNDFEDLRQIDFTSEIISLNVFDFNYDGFNDVIVGLAKGFEIYYGDATAAYNKVIKMETEFCVDKFVYGDYNRDGFFDLNYINKNNGVISTIFAKSTNSFYPELVHLKENGIIDVVPFYSKFVNGVAYLNVEGRINILSKVNSFSEEQKLALTTKPNLLSPFDYLNNGVIDFAFINEENNSLNFILREAGGLPENLFTIELIEQHSNLKIVQITKEKKCFYLFSSNKRSVEVLEIDFETFSFKRKFYYAEGFVQDVVIKSDYKNDLEIFILYSDNDKLGLQVQTKVDENYFTKLYPNLEDNWSDALIESELNRTIGYLQKSKANLIYKTVKAEDKSYKTHFNISLTSHKSSDPIDVYSTAKFSSERFYGIFKDSKKLGLFIDGKTYISEKSVNESLFRITDKNQLFFGKNKSIFISSYVGNSFYELKVDEKLQQFNSFELFKEISISSFIVEKLEPRSNNLIFTNTKNGLIEIRQLH